MVVGIYLIMNNVNGKGYIGQSVDIFKRWRQHKRELKKGCHNNSYLQNAWNKYGEENFSFFIIEKTFKKLLNAAEFFWINFFDTFLNGYNLTQGGDDNPMNYEVLRKKISISNSGKAFTTEHKKNISLSKLKNKNPMYGKHHSKKTKERIAQKHIGKVLSISTRKKISQNHADMKGKKNPRAKYTLWDIDKVYYAKSMMNRYNRAPNPCNCFKLKYCTYRVPCGGFIDFISCELINNLIREWI